MTQAEATNEIFTLFQDAWKLTSYPVVYPNVQPKIDPRKGSTPWARIHLQHISSDLAGLGSDTAKRYEETGIITVQTFTKAGKGLTHGQEIAKIVIDAFKGRKTPGGVWFRNVRTNEVGPDGEWYQINVNAEFTYDDIR